MSLPPHLGRFSEIELYIFKTKTRSSLKDIMCFFAEKPECCPGNAVIELIARVERYIFTDIIRPMCPCVSTGNVLTIKDI